MNPQKSIKLLPWYNRDQYSAKIVLPVGVSFKKAVERYAKQTGKSGMAQVIREIIIENLTNNPEFMQLWDECEIEVRTALIEAIQLERMSRND